MSDSGDFIIEYPTSKPGNRGAVKLLAFVRDILTIFVCCLIAAAIFAVPLAFVIINRNPVEPEVFICFGINSTQSNVCLGRGNCTAFNTCNCTTGYLGSLCTITTCFGLNSTDRTICSGNGTCVQPDQCLCKAGRSGPVCEHAI